MRALPRWKRKLALGCLFAAGAVIILSLSGPPNALLAQQDTGTQPVATPTPFQYGSSLPVCSDEVVNAVLTPSVGPTAIPSIDGPVSNCLWPSTPYPMNTDLGAIAAPGAPGPVSPLPQPATTPAPVVDWSDLPVCPDYMLTPPVEPTPISSDEISTAPTCKLLPVAGGWNPLYQEWLEQGRDLRELGYYGDPVPDPSQLFPTPTPAAQAAFEGAPGTTSKPILLRQPQLYLPLLQNGADLSTMAAERSAAALPAATPVPDDFWSNLPICPDYSLTPSVEPTAAFNVDARPTCRLSPNSQVYIDLLPYYEQGYDLSAMGFPGDPPGPPPVILLTPVAQAAAEVVSQTTSAPAPQGQPQLYLPLLQNGANLLGTATELSATPVPTATIIYTDRLNAPYIPIDQLPECGYVASNVPDTSVPNFYAPQCRVKTVAYVDIKALYDQGIDLEARGLPRDSYTSISVTAN